MVAIKLVSIVTFVVCTQLGFAHKWAYVPSPVPGVTKNIKFLTDCKWEDYRGRWYGHRQTNTVTSNTDGTCNHALLARYATNTSTINMCGRNSANGDLFCGTEIGTMTISYYEGGINVIDFDGPRLYFLNCVADSLIIAFTYNDVQGLTLFGYTRKEQASKEFNEIFNKSMEKAGFNASLAEHIPQHKNCKRVWN